MRWLESELETTLNELLAAGAPGALTLAVGPWGRLHAAVGFDSGGERLQATTPFDVGSVTKTFVATLVLALVEDGALALDDQVTTHLPRRFAPVGSATLRSLLNHTSGLADFFEHPAVVAAWREDPGREWDPEELVDISLGLPRHQPGTFRYANTNYILIGLVIESVTRRSLSDLLQQRILDPLGLLASRFQTADSIVARLVSTSDDLSRFLSALLRGEVLRPTSLREMLTTVPSDWDESQAYGLGIEQVESLMRLAPSPCGIAWGHVGLGQVTTVAFTTPDATRQVILMANSMLTDDGAWAALNKAMWAVLCPHP